MKRAHVSLSSGSTVYLYVIAWGEKKLGWFERNRPHYIVRNSIPSVYCLSRLI
jgi:hypothetical protein